MHINVRDFLAESVGYSRVFQILGERPIFEAVQLTDNINGEITISRLESSLKVKGHISTEIQLECHRCLRTFSRPTSINFSQIFSQHPQDDDLPIVDGAIDLAPLLEQEILLSLPIKILHAPDCAGIEDAPEKYTKDGGSSST